MNTPLSMLKTFASKIAGARQEIGAELAAMRERIASITREIRTLESAPIPPAEARPRIHEVVTALGAAWVTEHSSEMFLPPGPGRRALLQYGERGRLTLPRGIREDVLGFLCATRPEVAEEMLESLMHAVPYEAGPASSKRPELLADLMRDKAERETAEEAVIDEAAQAGIVVEHRPEVIRRRQQETRAAELQEQAVADRKGRQAALDAAASARSGGSRSEYLRAEREEPEYIRDAPAP